MKYSYYPGCTLRTKAKDLDAYARASAKALGFELEEIENWQCCGGVYPLGSDEIATKLSSVRALNEAKEKGQDLVTLCSACHHVIKRVNDDMRNVEDIRTRANNYMQLDEPYAGETNVLHYLEVLRDRVGFDRLREKVVHPLTGRKIGAYYGCLLLRPSRELEMVNSLHSRLKAFIGRFNGVSNRRLQRYLDWFCWREQFRRSARGRRELLFAHEASGTYVCTRELTHLESHPFLSLANRVSIGERYGYMSMVV